MICGGGFAPCLSYLRFPGPLAGSGRLPKGTVGKSPALIETASHDHSPTAFTIAHTLSALSPGVLPDVLTSPTSKWAQRLPGEILRILQQPEPNAPSCSISLTDAEIAAHLQALTSDSNPIIQATSLFILDYLRAELPPLKPSHPLVRQTLERIRQGSQHRLVDFPGPEKLAYFSNHYFFADVHSETLLELSELARIKTFQAGEVISDESDTCRELLLLIAGQAQIEVTTPTGTHRRDFVIGELLDELEVLSQTHLAGRILATTTPTRLIALPVDALDALLVKDRHFARKVLELETRRLKHFVGGGKME